MKRIGISTTVPTEVLLAAGYQPVDLNNIFVNDTDPERLVATAERSGFPLNCCSWIKGIYGACLNYGLDTMLGVTNGDCSNTIMLMEVLRLEGIKVLPFAYPERPDTDRMQASLEALAATLGTNMTDAEGIRNKLEPARRRALELDLLTWREGTVSGAENHQWLVSSSDFNQNHSEYHRQLGELLAECCRRQPYPGDSLRLAYIGVPPVYAPELYRCFEDNGARVVFNEIQRQFAMPQPGKSLAEQYSAYTYPYSIHERLRDITAEIERRRVDGIIHYVQAFCHRGIGDVIFRQRLKPPVLTIEGNDDFTLNHHIRTRIEAFLDMLERSRRIRKSEQKALV